MTRFIATLFVASAFALPAAAENPVSDHAELWDKARERTATKAEDHDLKEISKPEQTGSAGALTAGDQETSSD